MNVPVPTTVIVGGGFTGLFTALYLSQQRYAGRIVLINPADHFVFRPLLYELLTGQMNSEQVWPSFETLLAGSTVKFVQDSAEYVDLADHRVELTSGESYRYDYLVLAPGTLIDFYHIPGAAENALPFRSGQDALKLQQQLHTCLERASQCTDSEERRKLLTVAIVGAGDSGVELAATLGDWLAERYTALGGNRKEIRIVLLHRNREILSERTTPRLQKTARVALASRAVPVELLTATVVNKVEPERVEYRRDAQTVCLPAATIIWTAGTAIPSVIKNLAIPDENRDPCGRPYITPTQHLIAYPEVFAGGDCVTLRKPKPATAQVAYLQAKAIAQNLIAASAGEGPKAASLALRGTLMKLGLREAAAEIYDQYEVKGRLGHTIRQLTYLELLPVPIHNLKNTAEWMSDEIFQGAKNTAEPGAAQKSGGA
ncbi:NAD(P)/FAD-dependent oxidoreductase [Gloeobacter kilaueensis]|uniref:NADH dehydrogenase n=1 Tax=Gloeobacter kilaueensis (strain ATCC BAA-2537 / CCAP 1431/1 / ULC 316 / JS1) TaxID=1183438 RepID=U5QFN5_GLOK1|nr:NAD(P)/FAD-dependent oxidoreductase [Gloeobacter kilaueensis]AGY56409.1 NADH dehydrogenase [Gloeobacter kilaueensis JS1]